MRNSVGKTIVKTTVKQYFKSLAIFHIALIAGLVLATTAVCIVVINGSIPMVELKNISKPLLIGGASLVGLLFVFISFKVYTSKTQQLNNSNLELGKKCMKYRTNVILQYAMAEFPAIAGIVGIYLLAEPLLAIVSGITLVYFIWARPSAKKFKSEINLTLDELEIMDNPNAFLFETEVNDEND